jgi:hypothetical protein
MSNKPIVLTDNFFDNVVLHPSFVVQNLSNDDSAGHEAFRVADNLRDLTSWTRAAVNADSHIFVDAGAAVQPNTLIIERGHNLAGKQIRLDGYPNTGFGSPTSAFTFATVPVSPGGLPTDPNGCLTADGVWWKTFTGVSFRVQDVFVPAMGAGVAPIIPGIYLGTSYRFTEYLDAPAAYDFSTSVKYMRNEISRGGVRSKSRGINLDKLMISISVDSADYPPFDVELRRMLRYNVPIWFAFDDSDTTGVGQMRLFQFPGDFLYDPRVNPVHREIRVELEEVIPTLYV